MARLLIVYDPSGQLHGPIPELEVKSAALDIRDDIDNQDIYALAKKLAEMLLEQLA